MEVIVDMSKDNSFPQLYHKKLFIGNLKSVEDYYNKKELATILKKWALIWWLLILIHF